MTNMTIEEQIILQYAIPRSNREDVSCLRSEEVKRQRQGDWDRIDQEVSVPGNRDRVPVPGNRDQVPVPGNWDQVSGTVNWDRVLELALFHDVFPSVYRHMEDIGWLAVPEKAVRKFREKWHQHLARNLILSHEMDRIVDLFAKGGVKAIPLKGIFLARLLYPDITLRSFNDLDIWVRPSDAGRAGELLQQIGYELRFPSGQSYSAENEYSIPFHRYFPHTRIYVDLHWSLAKARDYPTIPEELWWQHAREVRISRQSSSTRNFNNQRFSSQNSIYQDSSDQRFSDQRFSGQSFSDQRFSDQSFSDQNSSDQNSGAQRSIGQSSFSLAPEDLLIYLTIQIHASTYCYLKHFVDIYQLLTLLGDQLDCKYIYQTAKGIGIVNNLFFVLLTVRNLFDTPIDASTRVSINTLIDTLLIVQHKPNQQVNLGMGFLRFYFLRHIFNRQTILSGKYSRDLRQGFCLLLYDRLTQSITSSLRVLFPSAEGIAARYQILPHSKKIYLYYCLNPFLILYWLFRGLVVKSSDAPGLGTLLGPV